MELIIVCGLMGVGKTTFAKKYVANYGFSYLDFDEEYHSKIQNVTSYSWERCKQIFLEGLIKNLNMGFYSNKDVIIDNWFKWHIKWYEDEEDDSLKFLKKKLKNHKLRVIYLFGSKEEILKRYLKKPEIVSGRDFNPRFEPTMEKRQRNLLKKIEASL